MQLKQTANSVETFPPGLRLPSQPQPQTFKTSLLLSDLTRYNVDAF